jgi:hypothetical protein
MDDHNQPLYRLRANIALLCRWTDQVLQDLILNHVGDKRVQRPPASSHLLQDRSITRLLFDPAFNGIELAADAALEVCRQRDPKDSMRRPTVARW